MERKIWFIFHLDDTMIGSLDGAVAKLLDRLSKVLDARPRAKAAIAEAMEAAKQARNDSNDMDFSEALNFVQLLQASSNTEENEEVRKIYELSMNTREHLKCGALVLMQSLRGMNKRIAFVTEGPDEKQLETISKLELESFIDHRDFLMAPPDKVSRKQFFEWAAAERGVAPGNICYIASDVERDLKPAREAGYFTIQLAEDDNIYLGPPDIRGCPPEVWDAPPAADLRDNFGSSFDPPMVRVNTLYKLHHVLQMDRGGKFMMGKDVWKITHDSDAPCRACRMIMENGIVI